jgi:hypothetical protein
VPFLIRRPGSAVWLDHLQAEVDQPRGVVAHVGLGVADLDAAEVLGADESVLAGTHQANGSTVLGPEGCAVEVVGKEDVVSEHVLEEHDRPVAVEALEHDVGDRGARADRGLDQRAVDVGERDASPTQPGRGPPGDTVEVGDDLVARKGRELGEGYRGGCPHRTGDLEARVVGNLGWRLVQVGAEAREAFDPVLTGWKRRVALWTCRAPSDQSRYGLASKAALVRTLSQGSSSSPLRSKGARDGSRVVRTARSSSLPSVATSSASGPATDVLYVQ